MDGSRVDRVVQSAIDRQATPGACYAVGVHGSVRMAALGRLGYGDRWPLVGLDTLWDLASLTKVVGTTTAAMQLVEMGNLRLEQPVAKIIPSFEANGKSAVTVRNLLLHDSGLPASLHSPSQLHTAEEVLQAVWAQPLGYETGTQTVYSDVGFSVLGNVIETLVGLSLDRYLREKVWALLGMTDTMFNPRPWLHVRCPPTEPVEPWRKSLRAERGIEQTEWIRGEVHDPTAMVLGGVAGHAGLFSTVRDLAKFMAALTGGKLVAASTLELFTTRTVAGGRALGWDTPSAGSSAGARFGPRSYGHTGFTGTSIWVDPDLGLFAILLTNRVHPSADNQGIRELRAEFHDAVVESTRPI
ncbi:MAG: serine hydrolase domain-containing protein [Fimbriimonadales bacterium]